MTQAPRLAYVEIGNVEFYAMMCASGVLGLNGKGYWFHKPFKYFGADFRYLTTVFKTITFDEHKGNMSLDRDRLTPREAIPDCIHVDLRKRLMLNAVDLSNPGLRFMLQSGVYQAQERPFIISLATTASDFVMACRDIRDCLKFLHETPGGFKAPFGVELDVSCSNQKQSIEDQEHFIAYLVEDVGPFARGLGIPFIVKLNVFSSPTLARRLSFSADALCVSNAIHWNRLTIEERAELFGTIESPLADYGGGALSGPPLFQRTLEWHRQVRKCWPAKSNAKLIFCGGLWDRATIEQASQYADACQLGSVCSQRPYKVRGLSLHGHTIFSRKNDRDRHVRVVAHGLSGL